MEHALIVASGEQAVATLAGLLGEQYPGVRVTAAASGSAARRELLEESFDVMIVSAPLGDENGVELCVETASASDAGVVLLVKTEYAEDITARVEEYGVFVVEKPLHKPFFLRALRIVGAAHRRMRGLESEKRGLQDEIAELRVINRAKCVLIQVLNLTEPQAHRYIEKQAMDLRTTKIEVARGVLKTYET